MENLHLTFTVKLKIIQSLIANHYHTPIIESHIQRLQFCKNQFMYPEEYDEFMQDHLFLAVDNVEKCKNKLTVALTKLENVTDNGSAVNDIVSEYESFSPAMPWNYTPPLSEYEENLWYAPTSAPPDYYALEFVKLAEEKYTGDTYTVVIDCDFLMVKDKTGWTSFSCHVGSQDVKMHYLNLRLLDDDVEGFMKHTVPPDTFVHKPFVDYLQCIRIFQSHNIPQYVMG